jgi:hypothetical protein
MTSKPAQCPRCGSEKVASILYGLPIFDEELKRRLNAQEVILGGCIISGNDPLWHCVECYHRWGKREAGIWEPFLKPE